jgi:hypothetical protein
MDSLSSPIGKNIVVYDLEIKRSIGQLLNSKKITWDDHHLMGISSLVIYDYLTGDYSVHLDDNMADAIERLNEADLVVGFNQTGFDEKVILGSEFPLSVKKNYDLLYYGRLGMGWRDGDNYPTGCKLDDFLLATLGPKAIKTGEGSLAPLLYQTQQIGKLISYNLADVSRTKKLFEHVWVFGTARTARHGTHKFFPPQQVLSPNIEEDIGPD